MDIKRCNTESLMCVFLVLVSMHTLKGGNGEVIRCIEKEKQALLKFKQEVIDQRNVLSSWGPEENKSECCSWTGVLCSSMTGHVTGLKLTSGVLVRLYPNGYHNGLVIQNLDSLSNLSSLSLLDLSFSNFTQSLETIMFRSILMIPSLKELYLKYSTFPNDTSSVDVYPNSTFASLTDLDLKGVSLTSLAFQWLFNISTSLVSIDLSSNKLDGPIPDAFGQKFVFLENLYLSHNRFEGGIPKSLQNLTALKVLFLDDNNLTEPIPEFIGTMVSMEVLDLSDNRITGSLPESVWELSRLFVLSVSSNSLEGEISESHLSNLHSLVNLDLSHNSLVLNLAPDWTPPFQLNFLDLASCNLGPRFPTWVHTQNQVSYIDLSCANISEELPVMFWDSFHGVDFLNLSHNHISGKLPDLPSKSFQYPKIDLSFNEFSGRIPLFHPSIWTLNLSNNKFYGTISFVCKSNFDILASLDLSNNQLSGQLPDCWENFPLVFLYLSNNNFSGNIPNSLGSNLLTLYLDNNNLSGELPSGLINSQSLLILDVGGNKLTGNISTWRGTNLTSLRILTIRGNNFFGNIPPEICYLTQIQVLDLSRNNLSGKIPPHCFENFTNLVQKSSEMDKEFGTSGYIYVVPHSKDKVVVQWKGNEYEYYNTHLSLLKLIDLSSNRIEGNIPIDIFQMQGLISLNLSRNHLTGNIDPAIHMMASLESLDLSRNQLSGEIPASLGNLSLLNTLDLSNNNFSGKIPSGTQLQTFNASAYTGNIDLCGPPLQRCPEDGPYTSSVHHGKLDNGSENDDASTNQSFLKEFYITIVLGFIVGFWGTMGTLLLKKSWRYAYFRFFDSLCLNAAICMRISR